VAKSGSETRKAQRNGAPAPRRRRPRAQAEAVVERVATIESAPRVARFDEPVDAEEPNLVNTALDALERLVSGTLDGVAPTLLRELDEEARAKIARAPMELNAYGYDPWGFNCDVARRALVTSALLYRYYFRVKTYGIENMPAGRVLVIANHAGQVAIDGAMIGVAAAFEADPPRILRAMGEYWLPTLPLFNVLMVRVGSVVGTPKNCIDLLEHGEAVMAFPEGVRGMNKSFSERYKLKEFGYGFMRLALQTNTPIVPVAVVGSEEQLPSFGNFKPLARLLGMPAFPLVVTPVPLPVRYHVYFGEPMEFRGNPNDEDQVIGAKVEQVKARIRSMIENGLRKRRSVFF
jgi:1-acyl-sn-glycerol-3-phosphate acyltransferase